MRRIHLSVIAMLLGTVVACTSFLGCGRKNDQSSSTSTTTKQAKVVETDARKSMNGWNESTNKSYTIDDLTFSVPQYFGEPKDDNWLIETGRQTSTLYVYDIDTVIPGNITDHFFENWYTQYIDGMKQSDNADFKSGNVSSLHRTTIAGYPAGYVSFDGTMSSNEVKNVGVEGYMVMISDSGVNKPVGFTLLQSKESEYSYKNDFDKIIGSIALTNEPETANQDEQTSENKNVDSSITVQTPESGGTDNSNSVTPELKAFLDSYEAFVDEYVVFMQKYQQNPTDTQLLSQYATFMGKYADFAQKINEYDNEESEMSTADLNYYIEVTARCSQKMLNAASSGQ